STASSTRPRRKTTRPSSSYGAPPDSPSSGLRPPSPRVAGRRARLPLAPLAGRGWREAPGEGFALASSLDLHGGQEPVLLILGEHDEALLATHASSAAFVDDDVRQRFGAQLRV